MPRDIDEKKTRKALRKLKKAKARAESEGVDLSDWEKEFVEGVEERLETYGSAFSDPTKGALDEALSQRQSEALKQIDKKSRGKANGGFKQRKPLRARKGQLKPANVRQLHDDLEDDPVEESGNTNSAPEPFRAQSKPVIVSSTENGPQKTPTATRRPAFKVIDGGKKT